MKKTHAWKSYDRSRSTCKSSRRPKSWPDAICWAIKYSPVGPIPKAISKDDQELVHVGLFELIDAFQRILNKVAHDHTVDLESDQVSIKDRMNDIIAIMEDKGSMTFTELFEGAVDKRFIIVTFLALLELMKLSLIHVVQHAQSGVIRLFYQ